MAVAGARCTVWNVLKLISPSLRSQDFEKICTVLIGNYRRTNAVAFYGTFASRSPLASSNFALHNHPQHQCSHSDRGQPAIISDATISSNESKTNGRSEKWVGAPALGFLYAALFSHKSEAGPEEDELVLLIKMAKLETYRGEFRKASNLYHQALRLVAERGEKKMMDGQEVAAARCTIFDDLANLALSLMQLDQAEKLFKETMRTLVQIGRDPSDNSMVEISLKLAMIYAMMGKNKEAEIGYKFCLETQQKKVDEAAFMEKEEEENAVALLGMVVNSYARFLMVQYRLKEAEQYLHQAIELCQRVYTDQHAQVAVLYNDLATVCSTKGDNDAAKEYFTKAVDIGEAVQSEELPTYLVNCGALAMEMGDLDKAKEFCHRSLKLAKKFSNKEAEAEAIKHLDAIKKKEKE